MGKRTNHKRPVEFPIPEEAVDENPALEHLLEIAREKGFVTIDDILSVFPDVERDMDQLEEVYSALLAANITYLDEVPDEDDAQDEELTEIEKMREKDKNDLAQIDADDSVGLYLKEVGRVPLLTAEQEVSLSKRIERGRKAREAMAKGESQGDS